MKLLDVFPRKLFTYEAEDEIDFPDGLTVVVGANGAGKCLGQGTPVLLFDGRIVAVEDVKRGDLLMGPDSRPRRVLSTTRGRGPLFEIVPTKGASWVCNDVHVLTLVDCRKGSGGPYDMPLNEYLAKGKSWRRCQMLFSTGVERPTRDLPVDPYFLGVWHGDGDKNLKGVRITKPDPEILAAVQEAAEAHGCRVSTNVDKRTGCPTHSIVTDAGKPNPLLVLLRKIAGERPHLPFEYLTASRPQRLQFLAGLLDTDGYLGAGTFEIAQKRRGWAEDICYLARSLGLRAVMARKVVNGADYWRVSISGETSRIPTRIPRKMAAKRRINKVATRTGFQAEALGEGDFYGFTIDGDGRFLLGDFTVTHNTAIGLESIAWTLWGKTTRGTSPNGDVKVMVDVNDDAKGWEVSRLRKGPRAGSLGLRRWGIGGSDEWDDMTGQTATETQGKIDRLVGTWERFCAERVFSNRLRARFGTATDKERKGLLEACLGLERHELAAKVARKVAGDRRNALDAVRLEIAGARAALAQAEAGVKALAPALGESVESLREQVKTRRDKLAHVTQQAAELETAARRAAERAATVARARDGAVQHGRALVQRQKDAAGRVEGLRAAAATADKMGDCPVCMTPAANISRERLAAHYHGPLAAAEMDAENLRAQVDAARAEVMEMQDDVENVAKGAAAARSAADGAAADARALASDTRLERALAAEERRAEVEASAREAVGVCQTRVDEAQGREDAAELACLEVEAAVTALGSKGARVARMEGALAKLTAEACRILARLPVDDVGPLTVKVEGSRTLAKGGEVDEVSITVTGAGGGEYDGTSDGERARVDVALMLGMSRVAGGEGLLIFDEIFDPLDGAALEAISDILQDLATRRQVVVITHNPRFLDLLPASSAWKVSRAGGASRITRA